MTFQYTFYKIQNVAKKPLKSKSESRTETDSSKRDTEQKYTEHDKGEKCVCFVVRVNDLHSAHYTKTFFKMGKQVCRHFRATRVAIWKEKLDFRHFSSYRDNCRLKKQKQEKLMIWTVFWEILSAFWLDSHGCQANWKRKKINKSCVRVTTTWFHQPHEFWITSLVLLSDTIIPNVIKHKLATDICNLATAGTKCDNSPGKIKPASFHAG